MNASYHHSIVYNNSTARQQYQNKLNWSEFDILSLFGMLASVTENLFKIFLKPDNDCHKSQFINSTKDGKVEILENYIHGFKQIFQILINNFYDFFSSTDILFFNLCSEPFFTLASYFEWFFWVIKVMFRNYKSFTFNEDFFDYLHIAVVYTCYVLVFIS